MALRGIDDWADKKIEIIVRELGTKKSMANKTRTRPYENQRRTNKSKTKGRNQTVMDLNFGAQPRAR